MAFVRVTPYVKPYYTMDMPWAEGYLLVRFPGFLKKNLDDQ